jgi:class 3 adenylate cyclase/tetratricopeptide (TPR) repeat protein
MALCPRCHAEVAGEAKFCPECGSELAAPPYAPARERKVVSVLFIDLVGFTAHSHDADPEDVHGALVPYYRRLRSEITRFGGTVEKFIGDAVVGVFGAPVVHEDDAERAVRSALKITEAIEELNQADPAFELAVRAAVNTGETLVSLTEGPETGVGMVTGDIVNTASRLQGIAPVGEVVVGEGTYRATRGTIDYEALEPVLLKGKPHPVPVWRALAVRARLGIEVDDRPSTPFVGREHDLFALENAYARMRKERSMQLVTIIGEPGIGKTRLVAELRAFLDDQPELVYWRQGRCLPYGEGVTFWALGEVVKAHAGILASDSAAASADKLRDAIAAVVEDAAEQDWVISRLGPMVGTSSRGPASFVDREELFAALRRFLESVAVQRPLILVFEDVHWADTAVLEFVEYMMSWSTDSQILILCAARPELFDKNPTWAGGLRNAVTLAIGPMSESETDRLITALLPRSLRTADLRATLMRRTGGNPLYAEECVRIITEAPADHEVGQAERSGEVLLPDSLQALIAARLDTLSPRLKSLLQDGAVVGKSFWVGALAFMHDDDVRSLTVELHALVEKEFVRPARRSSIAKEDEYLFRHALIRDVAYGQIPRADRARKHHAVATWIEQNAGDRLRDRAEHLVHHYGLALELARSSGLRTEIETFRAAKLRSLLLAGERAFPLDLAKAERHYRHALDLMAPSHAEWASALGKVTEASWLLGRLGSDEAEVQFRDAIESSTQGANSVCAGELKVKLARVLWERGELSTSRAELDGAVEILEREPVGPQLAYAYAAMTGERWASGASSECLTWADKTMRLATELGLQEEAILARGYRGSARCDAGDFDGLEDLRQALDQAVASGSARVAAVDYNNLGQLVWFVEGPRKALAVYGEGIEFAERRGLMIEARWMRVSSIETLYDLGRWDDVVSVADSILERDDTGGRGQAALLGKMDKERVLLYRDGAREGYAVVERFLHQARETKDPRMLVPALLVGAGAARAEQQLGRARELAAELAAVIQDGAVEWVRYLPDVVHELTRIGRMDAADSLLARVPVSYPRHRLAVDTGRAICFQARGDFRTAAGLYRSGAGRWAEYGCVPEEGRCLLGLGACNLRLRSDEAGASLEAAGRIFRQLGAGLLEREARELSSHLARVAREAEA